MDCCVVLFDSENKRLSTDNWRPWLRRSKKAFEPRKWKNWMPWRKLMTPLERSTVVYWIISFDSSVVLDHWIRFPSWVHFWSKAEKLTLGIKSLTAFITWESCSYGWVPKNQDCKTSSKILQKKPRMKPTTWTVRLAVNCSIQQSNSAERANRMLHECLKAFIFFTSSWAFF